MSSITTWNRLEPLPRTPDIDTGLRAEIADPLWLLARQRQFGEFAGDDAGTPVQAQVAVHSARLSRYHPGVLSATAATDSIDYDDAAIPLESVVEREAIRDIQGSGGLAYDQVCIFCGCSRYFEWQRRAARHTSRRMRSRTMISPATILPPQPCGAAQWAACRTGAGCTPISLPREVRIRS